MNYLWKIEGVKEKNGLITQAKYHVRAEQKDLWVATEGTWFFKDLKLVVPYADVTEEMVVGWIKAESSNQIETRLAEQIATLKAETTSSLPWAPQIFTPEI